MHDIKAYRIKPTTKSIGCFNLDDATRYLLIDHMIVYDHTDDAILLLAYPTDTSIQEARESLYSKREVRAEWRKKKIIKRG